MSRLSYPEDDPRLEVHRLALSEAEVAGYYYGLANRVLWPICHYFTEQMDIERSFSGAYRAVNERFADAAASAYRPGDTLWVQDYHLMLTWPRSSPTRSRRFLIPRCRGCSPCKESDDSS